MRAKSLALLVLALGCGLVASIGITQVMAKRTTEPPPPLGETVPVFVAMKDIPLGDPLSAQVLKLEQWPKDKAPPGSLARIEDVEGRRTRQRLYAGEPILENKLFGKGVSEAGASPLIPKGYRVVSVKVDNVSGSSSMILPGDRVDVLVYLTRNPAAGIVDTSTRTILEDIKVFAVNDVFNLDTKDSDEKSMTAKTISLLVTPEQAEKVTLASELGKIRLVMRSPEDDTRADSGGVSPHELFGRAEIAARSKETLVEPSPAEKRQQQGILEMLNAMRAKSQADKPQAAATERQAATWTVRVLSGTDVNDVLLESDASAEGGEGEPERWKINGPMPVVDPPPASGPAIAPPTNNSPSAPGQPTQPEQKSDASPEAAKGPSA